VVPARDVWSAIVQTAINLESSAVVSGLSSKMTAEEQAFQLGRTWEETPEPKRQFVFQVVHPDRKIDTFRIGPHTPTMKAEDIHLVHRLWLNITREPGLDKVHHHDVLTEALTRFAHDYAGHDRQEILRDLRKVSRAPVPTLPLESSTDLRPRLGPPADQEDNTPSKKDEGPPSPPVVGP